MIEGTSENFVHLKMMERKSSTNILSTFSEKRNHKIEKSSQTHSSRTLPSPISNPTSEKFYWKSSISAKFKKEIIS